MTDGLTEGPGEGATTAWPIDAPAEPDRAAGPRVLLLGTDESAQELTVALQRLGAEVFSADGETLTDAEELAATAQALAPDIVVTLSDAVDVAAVTRLEGQGSELVPSARAVQLSADRESLRRLAADELGLPTAPFWFVESLAELEAVGAHAGFPMLVKPVTGPSDRRRSVVHSADEVAAAWRLATEGSGSRVWAETVVDIEVQVTLIVVRSDGPSGPVIEFCTPIGHRSEDPGRLESWQPQQLSTAALDAAKSIAARIVKALGGRGVFSVELMINGDEVYFAEVTAGTRDSAWVTLRSQRLSLFELQARAILGVAVDTMMVSPGAAVLIDQGPAELSGSVLTVALGVPESDLRVFEPAAVDAPEAATPDWGVALATAPDVSTARERAREVATALNVRDSRA